MPAPLTENCTDRYIYQFLESYITPFMCEHNVHPNVITLSNMVVAVAILYSFNNGINKYCVLGMMILYHMVDCLDGAVARRCDKQSHLGLILDHVSDALCHMVYYYIVYISLRNHKSLRVYTKYYVVLATIMYASYLLFCISEILKIDFGFIFDGNYEHIQIFHDNGVLLHVAVWVLIVYLRA